MILFALVAAYLPWLHGKYLPLWGVAMAAFAWKAWKEKLDRKLFGLALAVPSLALALNCLFVFHIRGSLMPDALWVLHGYERSGVLVSRTTLPGLHYLFLGRIEGLFVYAPHLVLALAGVCRSRNAMCLPRSQASLWSSPTCSPPLRTIKGAPAPGRLRAATSSRSCRCLRWRSRPGSPAR